MMKYSVYQVRLSNEVYDAVEICSLAGSHLKAAEMYPEYKIHLDVMLSGSAAFKQEDFKYYSQVAVIEAKSLDDVFKIGNVGPEDKITRFGRMHSLSVGDIIGIDGKYVMIDGFGFAEIDV